MSLEKNFKEEILSLLNQYEKDHDSISIEEAQIITAVRLYITESASLLKLRHDLIALIEKLPNSILDYIPLVTTLKKTLRSVFTKSQYSLDNVLTFEAEVLREENAELKMKLNLIESKSHSEHLNQSVTDGSLARRIALLEKELTQSNQLLRTENKELLNKLGQSQRTNTQLQVVMNDLQTKVVSAESTIAGLQNELLKKETEIEMLRAENALLRKAQISAEKNSMRSGFR